MKVECQNPQEVVKEMFWLAWQACGGSLGMGFLQNKPDATREDVWNNIVVAGDYSGSLNAGEVGRPYADYVFGRMMKMELEFDNDSISWRDVELRIDYQAWCRDYLSYKDLYKAAESVLSV